MDPTKLIFLSLKVSVILSVFALGLEASWGDVTYLFRNPRQLIKAFLGIYIIFPLIAAMIIVIFSNIHPAVKIAIFALSVSPIPPLLPKKQLKAGANQSYLIGLLVAISLLAIAFVPLLIELFEIAFKRQGGIPPTLVAQIVLTMVLLPLAIGISIQQTLPKLAARIVTPLSTIASVFLLIGALFILLKAIPGILNLIGNGTLLALIIFVLLGLLVGHSLGGPDPDERKALAMSTASRHPGIVIAIASINFPGQKLSLAAIILYLLVNAIITIPYLKQYK